MREHASDRIAEEGSGHRHVGYGSRVAPGSDTIVRRRDDLISESVLDDVVVLDPATSRYVRLNVSSAVLWDFLDAGPATVADLAVVLHERLGAPEQDALEDALAFVTAMADRKFIDLTLA